MSFDINSITSELQSGAVDAAKQVAISSLKEAAADAVSFVQAALPALNRYTSLLIANQITQDEFKSLMLGLRDLAEMNGLTEAGLTAIKIDNTRNAILKSVTNIAIGAVSHLI